LGVSSRLSRRLFMPISGGREGQKNVIRQAMEAGKPESLIRRYADGILQFVILIGAIEKRKGKSLRKMSKRFSESTPSIENPGKI
jgi:hypothetical protein